MASTKEAVAWNHAQTGGRAAKIVVAVPNVRPKTKTWASIVTAPTVTVLSHANPSPVAVEKKERQAVAAVHSDSTKSLNRPDSATSSKSTNNVHWEYDVYATPFVPQEWQAINHETALEIVTTPNRHRIDSPCYTTTFAGTSFLPKRPAFTQEHNSLTLRPSQLAAQSYLHYFALKWQIELAAKELENKRHAIYKTQLNMVWGPDDQPLWALSVPGLREDSPLLEMGDILQLRQMWIDGAGNLTQVPMLVKDPDAGHTRYEYKSWTGIQYDAPIYSINRSQELVMLKAKGLSHLHVGQALVPMVVNVNFPLKHTSLEAQRRALSFISHELDKVISGSLNTGHPTETQFSFDNSHAAQEFSGKIRITSDLNQQIIHNDWIRRVLFPLQEDGILQTKLRTIPHRPLFDPAINFEQAHAVKSVCINDYGVLPYLISGPPGTGKTKTLVETAMQLLNGDDVAHILICAPSEAAADTLALRLKHYLSNKQLFRLNRPGRADNEVPQELTQYCYMENDMFHLPPFQTLMAFNVVVTSCQDAALLADARLTNNDLWEVERNLFAAFHPEQEAEAPIPALHWGALLIDEAAQATEIDVLSAITIVCPPSLYPLSNHQPRFVMAGDENQLGPRTASRNPDFSKSLFARLFERQLYANHPLFRSKIKPSSGPPVLKSSMLPIIFPPFANLIRNYRSHPAILSVPSSLFYNDTLIPEALTPNTPLQTSSLWRGRKWPVLFIPNTANDEIERDAGGWYNVTEAKIACSLAQTLAYQCNVQQADICIMSPFAAQVKLLRSLIRSSDYGGGSGLWYVNIGPLEAFQGLEKRVVILCTTRTRSRFLGEDEKRGMGIVGQKRKMNVALTRAKEALFVIGNPEVLGRDEHWRVWLAFCRRNGLVSDQGEVGRGDEEGFGNEKVGVLERALVAKEEHGGQKETRVLGHAASNLDMERDYELWMESLREALDEDLESVEEDIEDEVDDDLQDDDTDRASHETK